MQLCKTNTYDHGDLNNKLLISLLAPLLCSEYSIHSYVAMCYVICLPLQSNANCQDSSQALEILKLLPEVQCISPLKVAQKATLPEGN